MNLEEIPTLQRDHLHACKAPDAVVKAICSEKGVTRTPAIETVETWMNGDQKALVLLGGVGCGKSLAAAWAITKNLIAYDVYMRTPGDLPKDWRFRSAFFVQAQDLAWPRDAWEDTLPVLKRAKNCSLLVIDDCGTENGDGERGLDAVLRVRLDGEGRRTIMTSNLPEGSEKTKPPTGFRGRYGRRLLSRILGSGRIAICAGPDLRQVSMAG